jgi:VCBS repeat-containing protein
MGRRALIIALASFLMIAVGAFVVWAIVSSGTPTAAPTPAPPEPTSEPVVTPTTEPTETPTPTPSATPTEVPADPAPAPVTALAAKPAPHTVRLDWKNPADADLRQLVVVQTPGTTPPADIASGTIVAKLDAGATSYVDTSATLAPGKKYSYSVFARDAALTFSVATGITVTLPAALTITPVDVTGDLTQQAADAVLTDKGSLAFTAFNPKGPRIAVVQPAAGVTGTLTRVVTEPVGAAPGAVAWTYAVQNAALRSLAEGAKRDELFVLELRDGKDRVPTTVTITLHGINDAPTASAIAGQTAFAGDAFAFPIPAGTFADVDTTDTLTLSTSALPAWLSFTGTGFTGSPTTADGGTTTVTVTATDPFGASVSADVAIDVVQPLPTPNQPPVPGADAVTFDLGVDPLQTSAALLGNDSDPDGGPNPLSVIPAASGWQVNGELAGSYTIDAAGTLHLDSGVVADGPLQKLGAGEQATATISYSVTDGADTVQTQITVTVIGSATKAGEYDVAKVFVPPAEEPGRTLANAHH